MKFKYLALAILPLALAACQSSDLTTAKDVVTQVVQQQNADKILSTYTWSTTTANAPRPLVLTFAPDGRLSVETSCNTLAASWKVDANKISASNMITSLMACPETHMKQEGIAGQIFDNRAVDFTLNMQNLQQPTLTLSDAKGEKYIFTGTMTPEALYQTQAETIFLEVSPETKQCTGVAPQTCLQVKEIKYAENGVKTQVDKDWTLFYDKIQGFEHTPNERQVIRVKRYELKNPAADQSKYAYVYDMSVEREAIQGSL